MSESSTPLRSGAPAGLKNLTHPVGVSVDANGGIEDQYPRYSVVPHVTRAGRSGWDVVGEDGKPLNTKRFLTWAAAELYRQRQEERLPDAVVTRAKAVAVAVGLGAVYGLPDTRG